VPDATSPGVSRLPSALVPNTPPDHPYHTPHRITPRCITNRNHVPPSSIRSVIRQQAAAQGTWFSPTIPFLTSGEALSTLPSAASSIGNEVTLIRSCWKNVLVQRAPQLPRDMPMVRFIKALQTSLPPHDLYPSGHLG
jgi:hypothetical protein